MAIDPEHVEGLSTRFGLAKPIILQMFPAAAAAAEEQPSRVGTAGWDAEAPKADEKMGLLQRIPGYITREVADDMDVFCHVTEPCRSSSAAELVDHKTCADTIKVLLHESMGHSLDVAVDTLKTLRNTVGLTTLIGADVPDERCAQNTKHLWQMSNHCATELALRAWASANQFPTSSVQVLTKDAADRMAAVQTFAGHWDAMQQWE